MPTFHSMPFLHHSFGTLPLPHMAPTALPTTTYPPPAPRHLLPPPHAAASSALHSYHPHHPPTPTLPTPSCAAASYLPFHICQTCLVCCCAMVAPSAFKTQAILWCASHSGGRFTSRRALLRMLFLPYEPHLLHALCDSAVGQVPAMVQTRGCCLRIPRCRDHSVPAFYNYLDCRKECHSATHYSPTTTPSYFPFLLTTCIPSGRDCLLAYRPFTIPYTQFCSTAFWFFHCSFLPNSSFCLLALPSHSHILHGCGLGASMVCPAAPAAALCTLYKQLRPSPGRIAPTFLLSPAAAATSYHPVYGFIWASFAFWFSIQTPYTPHRAWTRHFPRLTTHDAPSVTPHHLHRLWRDTAPSRGQACMLQAVGRKVAGTRLLFRRSFRRPNHWTPGAGGRQTAGVWTPPR